MSNKQPKISNEAAAKIEAVINFASNHDMRDSNGEIMDDSGEAVYEGAYSPANDKLSMTSYVKDGSTQHVSQIEAGYLDRSGDTRPVDMVGTQSTGPDYSIGGIVEEYKTQQFNNGQIEVKEEGKAKEVYVSHTHKDGNVTHNNLTGKNAERAAEIIANRVARQMGGVLVEAAQKDIDKRKF